MTEKNRAASAASRGFGSNEKQQLETEGPSVARHIELQGKLNTTE